MTQITREFDEPFNESTASLPGTFSPSVVGIAGVPYLMDTSPDYVGVGRYKRESFDVVQQRNTVDARDQLLLPVDVWRQQSQSWHLGMGQSNVDRDNAFPYRYEESFGIDPWTQYQIGLLKKTNLLAGTGSLAGETWLTTVGDYLVVVNGQKSYWYNSLSASAPVGSVTISAGNNIVDIANSGYTLTAIAADGYVWYVDSPTATPTKWTNTHYSDGNFIAWQKDYLFVGDGNVLKTAAKGGSVNTIYTYPDTAFRWHSAADGNSCVYVLGRIGDTTVIHRVNIKSDGTGLNPCIVAAQLPDGEVGYCVDSYLGFILIGTDKGVRVATPTNDAGDLQLGPVIPTSAPVYDFEGQDRFVWYTMSKMNSAYKPDDDYFPYGTVCGLGRLDLSVTTTSSQTPGYASDICAIGQSDKTVRSVNTFENRRLFSIDSGGVWYEDSEILMESGWLKQGVMSFSVEDTKTGLYMQMKTLPLRGSITIDVSYDSSGFVSVSDLIVQDTVRSGNLSLNGVQFSRINARYRLNRDSATEIDGPYITRWEVRAVPVRGRTSRWTLPIMNFEDLEIDGVKYTRDPSAVVDTLVGLCESGQLFVLQESNRSYQVHAKEFTWHPEKLMMNGKGWQGIFTLVVEEVQ